MFGYRSFDAFWSPIGSLLAPFWRPLVPFERPYGTLWLTSGSILAPVGSLLVTLAVDFLTFEGSCRHFSYIFVFSSNILCKIVFFLKIRTANPIVGSLSQLFRRLVFRCILVTLWLHFGSLWLTFGSLVAPFGSLLAPVGSLLAHFWYPLAHFTQIPKANLSHVRFRKAM